MRTTYVSGGKDGSTQPAVVGHGGSSSTRIPDTEAACPAVLGGNAVDAAIAGQAALAVVAPRPAALGAAPSS
jgi:gamma-glutamyltranspeptidase